MFAAEISKHSVLNVEQLFKVAHHQILDLYCMFDLAVGASTSSDQSSKVTKHQMFIFDLTVGANTSFNQRH